MRFCLDAGASIPLPAAEETGWMSLVCLLLMLICGFASPLWQKDELYGYYAPEEGVPHTAVLVHSLKHLPHHSLLLQSPVWAPAGRWALGENVTRSVFSHPFLISLLALISISAFLSFFFFCLYPSLYFRLSILLSFQIADARCKLHLQWSACLTSPQLIGVHYPH